MASAPDPLTTVFLEVEARTARALDELDADHTRAAFDAYCAVSGEMEPVARGAMATLVPHVARDAAAARGAMRDDPAAPGLARQYEFLLAELSSLATVFSSLDPATGAAPDPADEHAAEYRAVCDEIRELIAASRHAEPVWELLRQSRAAHAAARGRPPPRQAPRGPLADDREYYA